MTEHTLTPEDFRDTNQVETPHGTAFIRFDGEKWRYGISGIMMGTALYQTSAIGNLCRYYAERYGADDAQQPSAPAPPLAKDLQSDFGARIDVEHIANKEIMLAKNRKYGDAWTRSHPITLVDRIREKAERAVNMIANGIDDDESVEDNLRDIANYALLALWRYQAYKAEKGGAE